ncbi:MAG: hypothetical protein H6601_11700 [Flavobacteriales bacterium]|nr:hypothetical protein [Flavobacteriales bacterium]
MGKRFDNSPTCLLSDEEIWKIYSIVSISFDQIADLRKEKLPDDCILYIVHCYLERYEFFKAKGSDAETDMFEKLNYETTSYLREGVAGTYELIDPENEIICGGVIRDDDEG